MIQVDAWSWKCARCGWEVRSLFTLNPQPSVADALVKLHIRMHEALSPLENMLAEFVQEHMPWPFGDVSRYDSEGADAARDIAKRLIGPLEREFADITQSARESSRSRSRKRMSEASR